MSAGVMGGGWQPYVALPGSTVTGTLLQWSGLQGAGVGDNEHAPRTLLAWLPPSYDADPQRRYPVIYFHDGQNVFDAATSFSGEWGADEVLTELVREGLEAVAIGIPNGGERRFHEYSPVLPPQEARDEFPPGGGGADAYVRFLAEVVKPLVDATLRTRPAPEFTHVVGSSMGGVVSLHALLTRPDVFGHAGLLSPAFWTGGDFAFEQAAACPLPAGRVWLDVGGRESDDPAWAAAYRQDAERLAAHWQARGLGERLHFMSDPQAIHHESAWRSRLPSALRFLLAGPVSEVQSRRSGLALSRCP